MTEPTDQPASPTSTPTPTSADEPWRPPRTRDSNIAAVVLGLILLAIGIWFLLDFTLGFEMPRIRWSDIWPVILVILGGLIVYQAMRRRA